jgi:acyl-CoA reductase-like NAD-dependent aldehyde dehydrogenase
MEQMIEAIETSTDCSAIVAPAILNQAATDFVTSTGKLLFIGGRWVTAKSGKTFETIDPTTETPLTTIARGDVEDIDLAVKAARRAFEKPSWANISPHQRSNYLFRIADLIEKHCEELAMIQSLDMGMLLAQSRGMTAAMTDVFRYYAGWTTKIFGRTFPSDGSSMTYTLREPLGVIGAIIPWNGPVLATAWKIAPAIACGNAIVLKPAEQASLVSLRMAELIQEAGLPDGVVNVVTGFGDAGAALVAHRDVNKISFTGSTDVGKQIVSASAGTLKKVTLELGGKSPNIIFPDADLEKAIPAAVTGFCAGAGQGCVAGSRIFIHESMYEEVADRISEAAQHLKIGSPFESSTQLGPLASQEQFDRVRGYIKIGKDEGGKLKSGGNRYRSPGYFIEPTIFTGVTDEMRIVHEEIFGPVAVLLPFKDERDAIFRGNDTEFGLAAAIWTKDISKAHTVARSLQAGIVWINTLFELDSIAPFGGYKQSGLGKELGPDSIDAFTQTKTVVVRF